MISAAGWRLSALAVTAVSMIIAIGAFSAHSVGAFNQWVGWAAVAGLVFAAVGLLPVLWDKARIVTSKSAADRSANSKVRETLLNRASEYIEALQHGLIKETVHLELRLNRRLDLMKPLLPDQVPAIARTGIADDAVTGYFNRVGHRLVLLGAPGSGKTSLLARTGNDLISAAQKDQNEPIPVYLNLSIWNDKDRNFHDWLIESICHDGFYQIDESVVRFWLENHGIVLLLDGLDEVADKSQASCLNAMVEFRKQHGSTRLILCCRTSNFINASKSRREFNEVLEIQPPTKDEVIHTLSELEKRRLPLSVVSIRKSCGRAC
jgi:hypothetical protein